MKITRLVFILSLLLCAAPGCSPSGDIPTFDRSVAFDLLKKQVEIGPRYPGAPGHAACRDLIVAQLKPYADEVAVQEFKQTVAGKTLALANVTARFNPRAKSCIILAAHWDTRPVADMEIDPARQAKPIAGANDGASGVAVLLELARLFKQRQPEVGVLMVFFDGEDYAVDPPSADTMFLGSKYFAAHLDSKAKAGIKYGILLDMIGDKNLGIYQEAQSVAAAPEVVKKVWDTAKSLGYEKSFIASGRYDISDDHIPLIKAGVKCIDVIDFDYGPWHTLQDTVDKCSAESLGTVGDVIARVVYEEKAP